MSGNKLFEIGARVRHRAPPPGVVVGYVRGEDGKPDYARVAVRLDGHETLLFLPPWALEMVKAEDGGD